MKLSEIKNGNLSAEWAEKGYELPKFDIEAVKAKTHAEPTWVHFGAGNIFRAFPAAILNDALNTGKYDRGVIVAESFDYEIIDKAYRPYDNMSLLVCLKSTGEIEKKVVASVTESLKADYSFGEDWARLVLYCDRETVDKIEKMKVCTCLNPLHTAMSIYGCMLGYTLISAEMADEDLRAFIQKIGYIEAMPVVVDPGVLNPYEFIGAVINRRLPNPFMPDAPQRIATDTSQKLAIRFGETIKAYEARGLDKGNLILIPLVLAGYARYLKGIDDNGQAFEPSADPLLAELQAIVAPLEVKEGEQDFSCLKKLYSRVDVFGVDLYAVGLGEKIEAMAKELFAGPGAVRKTLHKYTLAR